MGTLLHIFDSSDSNIEATANSRTYPGTREVVAIDSSRSADLYSIIDSLVSFGTRADAILFETHGCPGNIFFGGVGYDAAYFSSCFGRGWESILSGSNSPKIYFNGCNVASDAIGWNFLKTMAKLFINTSGQVVGHTSLGLEIPIWSYLTGHVVHLTGNVRTVFISRGRITEMHEQSDI